MSQEIVIYESGDMRVLASVDPLGMDSGRYYVVTAGKGRTILNIPKTVNRDALFAILRYDIDSTIKTDLERLAEMAP